MKNRVFIVLLSSLLMLGACARTGGNSKNQQAMATTIHLTTADFKTKVADYEKHPSEWKYLGDKPAIIDFYASWCGPCRSIAPILEELAKEYGDKIYVYKVDTEQEPELSSLFGIRSIPSLLFVPMKGQPTMMQGAMPKSEFVKAIDSLLLK